MRSLVLVALVALLAAPAAGQDFVIRGATIYDGTGGPPIAGDVAVTGGKITGVGKVDQGRDAVVYNAKGLVLCPGFIDLHTHCDSGVQTMAGKAVKNYTTQGVTTVVTGNCGSGPVDAGKYFATLTANGVGPNVIHQVPHNSVREAVMGNANREPTAAELAKMEALVAKAVADGAWGMSTGLIYTPGTYAKTEEIIALAKVVGAKGGHYASHIRNEGTGLLTAIEEAIRVGKEAKCAVHVSHIKASGKAAHGSSAAAVALIETARAAGQVVTADQYPYTASSTSLRATLVPAKYREGSQKDFVARMDDPVTGPKLKADVVAALKERDDGALVQVARYAPKPAWQGKRVAAVAAAEKREAIDIVLEIERAGGAQVVNFGMTEEDVRLYMKRPWVATASDGGVQSPGDTVPHPRGYGTFPRKVGFYAIEEKMLPVEQAVRSCTGLPADILKLADRGYIKEGQWADLVVFDPKQFRDTATYEKPHQYAAGVQYVFVNGTLVIKAGEHVKDALPGKVLRFAGK